LRPGLRWYYNDINQKILNQGFKGDTQVGGVMGIYEESEGLMMKMMSEIMAKAVKEEESLF